MPDEILENITVNPNHTVSLSKFSFFKPCICCSGRTYQVPVLLICPLALSRVKCSANKEERNRVLFPEYKIEPCVILQLRVTHGPIGQFRYVKIQPKTHQYEALGITTEFVGFTPQCFLLNFNATKCNYLVLTDMFFPNFQIDRYRIFTKEIRRRHKKKLLK